MFDKSLTEYLAKLSKLEMTETELERVTNEMSDIIALMDRVKEIDYSLETYTLPAVDFDNLREDLTCQSFKTSEIISNAKAGKDSTFTVPKVV